MAPPAATTPASTQQAADTSARPAAAPTRQTTSSWRRNATDDEILGISSGQQKNFRSAGQPDEAPAEPSGKGDPGIEGGTDETGSVTEDSAPGEAEAEKLRGALDANPQLRAAWEDAEAYRKVFATPQEAQAATALLGDLNRMDALFFSRRPEDHAQLAHAIADLDPEAFTSLARAINAQLASKGTRAGEGNRARSDETARGSSREESREALRQRPEENAARAEAPGLTP